MDFNKTIIQYGYCSEKTVTFPIAFTSVAYVVDGKYRNGQSSSGNDYQITDVSLTSASHSRDSYQTWYWIAIGI